jgi:hypothetical protein
MLTSARHLQKLCLHVSSRLFDQGSYKRVKRWAPYLLFANGLEELQSLKLLYVPLLLDDLLEILRRCSPTLTHLELRLDQTANRGDAWVDLWEQLASMERLHHLKLERPQPWFHSEYFDYSARSLFVNREEISQGLARLADAEPSRAQNRIS